jgi:PAS domain S-box-containing protein
MPLLTGFRVRLQLLLLGTVLLVLLVVGAVLTLLVHRYHEADAQQRFDTAFQVMEQALFEQEQRVGALTQRLAGSSDIVTPVNMVVQYASPGFYDPLIFDPEKQRMARALQRVASSNQVGQLTVYDSAGHLMAFHVSGEPGVSGWVSFENGQPVVYLNPGEPAAGDGESGPVRGDLPAGLTLQVGNLGADAAIGYQRVGERLALVASAPVLRRFPGGETQRIGHVVLTEFMVAELAQRITGSTGARVAVLFDDGTRRGTLEGVAVASIQAALEGQGVDETGPVRVAHPDLFLAARPLVMRNEWTAYLAVGLPRDVVSEEQAQTWWVLLAVLVLSALLILPLGAWGVGRYVLRPIDGLVRGAEAVRRGERARVHDSGRHELGRLASAFNAMAETIAERELALQRERDYAAGIINTAPVIVLLLNLDGTIRHVNPYFEQLTGHRADDIRGRDWFDLFLPERDRETIRGLFSHSVRGVATRGHVNPILTRAGEERFIEWNDDCLHDASGQVTAVLAIGLDVTERKRAEASMRIKDVAIDTSINAIAMADFNGVLTYVNQAFADLWHLPGPQAAIGRLATEFWERPERAQAVLQDLVTRGHWQGMLRAVRHDGSLAEVDLTGHLVRDENEQPVCVMGFFVDVTERVRAHEALARSELELRTLNESLEARVAQRTADVRRQSLRYDAILGGTPDGFFSADIQGRLTGANAAFCNLLGYTQAEILQLSIADFEGSEDPAAVAAHIGLVMRQGHDRFDTLQRRKDGTLINVEVSASRVVIDDEDMLFAFVRDITPRIAAAAALEFARDAAERAKAEAEQANAAKSEFLSRMSHELRTPLNAVLGFAQLLQADPQHPLTEIQADNVTEIVHAGEHLLGLVNEVLDLSRIESGRIEVRLAPVDSLPLIESCLKQIQPLAEPRGIQVALEPEGWGVVQADATRLRQVLLNLLSNAIKYNREGGRVVVRCTPSGERLRVSVADTGKGIAAEAMPRLFRPFERLESAYDGIEGTGIGLALARKLVESMGGDIGVESVPGQGSTFWFELPLAAPTATPASATVPGAPSTGVPPPGPAGMYRVLCIEDNPANLRLVRKMLTRRPGIVLLEAGDAEAGLEMAARQAPDLILLDINMPGMDGYQVLQVLQADPRLRQVPVVAVTANAMPRDVRRGMAAGFVEYLTKPLELQRLLEVVDTHLAKVPVAGGALDPGKMG